MKRLLQSSQFCFGKGGGLQNALVPIKLSTKRGVGSRIFGPQQKSGPSLFASN